MHSARTTNCQSNGVGRAFYSYATQRVCVYPRRRSRADRARAHFVYTRSCGGVGSRREATGNETTQPYLELLTTEQRCHTGRGCPAVRPSARPSRRQQNERHQPNDTQRRRTHKLVLKDSHIHRRTRNSSIANITLRHQNDIVQGSSCPKLVSGMGSKFLRKKLQMDRAIRNEVTEGTVYRHCA